MNDLITDEMVAVAADLLRDELLGTTGRSRRPTTSPGFRESMRSALEAAAPLIAAKAWEEGYQACRNRPRIDGYLVNRANPYQTRADRVERGEA